MTVVPLNDAFGVLPDPGQAGSLGELVERLRALRAWAGAAQVRVQDSLPPDLPEFTGRCRELEQLRQAVRDPRQDSQAAVIAVLEGMAGVGKTKLAIHAAHLLMRENLFERVVCRPARVSP